MALVRHILFDTFSDFAKLFNFKHLLYKNNHLIFGPYVPRPDPYIINQCVLCQRISVLFRYLEGSDKDSFPKSIHMTGQTDILIIEKPHIMYGASENVQLHRLALLSLSLFPPYIITITITILLQLSTTYNHLLPPYYLLLPP